MSAKTVDWEKLVEAVVIWAQMGVQNPLVSADIARARLMEAIRGLQAERDEWAQLADDAKGHLAIALGRAEQAEKTLASSWQPIESAPKDGTSVYLWTPLLHDVRAHWTTYRGEIGNWHRDFGGLPVERPTHWRPVPAAPKPSPA